MSDHHDMVGVPLIVFIHHPKAGGTSFHKLLGAQFGHESRMHLATYWGRLCEGVPVMAIGHHFNFGIHRYIPDRPVRYITCLRRSLPRQISNYHFAAIRPDQHPPANPGLKRLIDAGMTIEGYLSWWQRHGDPGSAPPLPWANEQTRRMSEIDPFENPEAALSQAIVNLRRCECVGVQERYDEWIELCRAKLGLTEPIPEKRWNQATPEKAAPIAQWALDAHARFNALDDALWKVADELLTEQRIAAGLPGRAEEG